MPPLGRLGDLATGAGEQALAFGLGLALGSALNPAGTALAYKAWGVDPIRVPEAGILAEGVAQGQVDEGKARAWAKQHGFDAEAFEALVAIADTGPAIGMALAAWRRGELSDDLFETALQRAAIEEEFWPALKALRENPLEPAAIAQALHRGIMRGAGLLVVEPPDAPGRVPQVPPSRLEPVEEAAWSGVDRERLRVMVGNAGLPPGGEQMLSLLNRGVIEESDFLRGVGQSNLRNEWGEALLELRRRLLTPTQYVEARLRGWIGVEAMHTGAALSGMEQDDTDLLAKLSGRPISFRQVFIGLRRGGHYDGPTGPIDPAFLKALQESNIRPEWYALAWAQRYSYPSAFVLRGLAQAGDLTGAEAEQILLFQGWEPELAKKVAGRWAGQHEGAGKLETKAELADEYEGGYVTEEEFRAGLKDLGYVGHVQDLLVHLGDARRIRRHREKLIDAIGKAYIAKKIDDTLARSELAEANVTGSAMELLLSLWGKQRSFAARL